VNTAPDSPVLVTLSLLLAQLEAEDANSAHTAHAANATRTTRFPPNFFPTNASRLFGTVLSLCVLAPWILPSNTQTLAKLSDTTTKA
jgi:hypothetical protein